jgi:CRP-like cAMP-binding protein
MNHIKAFFGQYPTKTISKGEVILQQNDVPEKAYAIKKGIMRVCNITSNGEEKILSFKVADDIFPVCWIFSKIKRSLFYYQAHTDCEVYVLDKADIMRQLNTSPDFSRAILDKQVITYVNSELQVEALEQSRAYLKLLYTFRHLALTHGTEIRKDFVRIKIPLTQQELANFTGLTRETTTAELNKLRQSKVIFSDRRYYSVDTSKVNDFIDDEYDPGVTINL